MNLGDALPISNFSKCRRVSDQRGVYLDQPLRSLKYTAGHAIPVESCMACPAIHAGQMQLTQWVKESGVGRSVAGDLFGEFSSNKDDDDRDICLCSRYRLSEVVAGYGLSELAFFTPHAEIPIKFDQLFVHYPGIKQVLSTYRKRPMYTVVRQKR